MKTALLADPEPAATISAQGAAESVSTHSFTPTVRAARSAQLADSTIAVLAKTAAEWFVPTLAKYLIVNVVRGRIRLAGHIQDARPLARLKVALLRLPGIRGLDQIITVESTSSRLQPASPAYPRRLQAG